MAGVVICDRCSRFGRQEALGGLAFRTNISDEDQKSEHKELCPKCIESLIEWLGTPPKDASEGPFTEPYKRPAIDGDAAGVKALTATPEPARRGRALRR